MLNYQGFCWNTCQVFPSCFSLRIFLIFIQYSYFSIFHTGANFYHQTTISASVSMTSPAHPPPTPTLCDPFCVCLSTSELCWCYVPKEAPQAFSLHVVPLSGLSESPLRDTQLWEHLQLQYLWSLPFWKLTSCFDSDEWTQPTEDGFCTTLAVSMLSYMKGIWLWLSSTVWK